MNETSLRMPWKPFLAFGLVWGVIAGFLQTILLRWVFSTIPELTWTVILTNIIIWSFAALALAAWLRWRAIKRMKAKELEDATRED